MGGSGDKTDIVQPGVLISMGGDLFLFVAWIAYHDPAYD
jgi:hypothetical protein